MWTILYNIKHSWTLTNMSLNHEGPLSGYFSLNAFYSTTRGTKSWTQLSNWTHTHSTIGSKVDWTCRWQTMYSEDRLWNYKWIFNFMELGPLTLWIVQESTLYHIILATLKLLCIYMYKSHFNDWQNIHACL